MRQFSRIAGPALAATVLAAAAISATGSPAEQIHACVTNGGVVKIVAAGTTCPNGQTAMSWNAEGPAGPQGAPGPTGPQGTSGEQGAVGPTGPIGPTGPQGSTGVVSAYGRLGDQTFVQPNDPPVQMTAFCNPGDVVTGGGFWNWNAGPGGDRNGVVVSESSATGLWQYPDPDPGDNLPLGGWKVRAQNKGNAILILSANVQCLHLGS